MNAIRKDIFVTRADLPVVIKCTQGTNLLPWIFRYMDYNIPEGATARIYVKKPSGKEVYNAADISGSEVTVAVTTQMVAESGKARAQIQIVKEGKILNTFVFLVEIEKGIISDLAVESLDEYDVLDKLIEEARRLAKEAEASKNAAAGSASTASTKAEAAAQSATTAAESAKTATEQASAAGTAKTAAETAQKAAQASQTAAAASATTAGQQATAAQTARTAAEAAAKAAEKSAEIAAGVKQTTMNLLPSSWTGNGPYTYTIKLEGLSATQLVYVHNAMNLTEAQINAFADACITGKEQTAGQIVLQALSKPVAELPIVIEVGGEVVK